MTWRLSVFVPIVLLAVTPLNSQTFRGAINGTVMDPAGAVVPNAQVKATDTATQIEHTSATTSDERRCMVDVRFWLRALMAPP